MRSPLQRSKAFLEQRGYTVAIVERRVPYNNITQDLLGFIDLLGIKAGMTIGVQTTSGSNLSARVNKIISHENYEKCKAAGWKIEAHGWVKRSLKKKDGTRSKRKAYSLRVVKL